jgi:hypothetical protein
METRGNNRKWRQFECLFFFFLFLPRAPRPSQPQTSFPPKTSFIQLSRSSGAPLPRGASNALCSRCGKVLGAGGKDEIAVRPLSRSCRRRRRRAAATAAAATAAGATEPSSSSRRGRNVSAATSSSKELNTVVLVVKCGACGQAKRARGFYTRELAEAAASALRRGENGGGGGGGGGGG